MKKTAALLLSLLTVILALTSCSGDSDVPSGMQLVAGGEELGYFFYAPEEWTISNVGVIKSAYASRVDTSSISFVEVDPFAKLSSTDGIDKDEYFFNSYFSDSLSEFPNAPKVSDMNGESIVFGKADEKADRAKKYTFTYEQFDHTANKTYKFGFMQILIKANDTYYIFTYSASMDKRGGTDTTYYDFYLGDAEDKGKVMEVIEEFRFVDKSALPEEEAPETDEDGFILVSDSDLSKFDLYAPADFEKDYASGIVSATHSDGSNINMTGASGTNENVNTYILRRFGELSTIVTDLTYEHMYDEDGEPLYDANDKQIVKYETIEFGNAAAANAYEYSFTYNGIRYKVYQVIVIEGHILNYHGYVFTYTAKEVNFDLHFEDILKTIEKVDFK